MSLLSLHLGVQGQPGLQSEFQDNQCHIVKTPLSLKQNKTQGRLPRCQVSPGTHMSEAGRALPKVILLPHSNCDSFVPAHNKQTLETGSLCSSAVLELVL